METTDLRSAPWKILSLLLHRVSSQDFSFGKHKYKCWESDHGDFISSNNTSQREQKLLEKVANSHLEHKELVEAIYIIILFSSMNCRRRML